MSKTSSTAKNKYNAKAYDRLDLRVYKGEKQEIQDAANAAGLSLNAYVREAILEKMGKEKSGADS